LGRGELLKKTFLTGLRKDKSPPFGCALEVCSNTHRERKPGEIRLGKALVPLITS
jgi:hypothetical protein